MNARKLVRGGGKTVDLSAAILCHICGDRPRSVLLIGPPGARADIPPYLRGKRLRICTDPECQRQAAIRAHRIVGRDLPHGWMPIFFNESKENAATS